MVQLGREALVRSLDIDAELREVAIRIGWDVTVQPVRCAAGTEVNNVHSGWGDGPRPAGALFILPRSPRATTASARVVPSVVQFEDSDV